MIWLTVHSLLVIALTMALGGALAASAAGSPAIPGLLLAAEGVVAFAWLAVLAGRTALRAANLVTSVRLASAVALVLAAAFPARPAAALAIFVIAAAGEATDFLDGLIARRRGPTAFGARLDMETDAFFMLSLSLVAVRWYGLPSWVLLAGLARYLTAVPFLFLPEPRFPRAFSLFAKAACAVAALLLLAAIVPAGVGIGGLRPIAAAAAVMLLVVSFGWEALIRVAAALGSERNSETLRARAGLLKSVITYYGVPFRQRSMRRFYRRFVQPGDLVFDIGAHVGNRVVAIRALGARVVAVEPQPLFVRLLERLFVGDDGIALVPAACGREEKLVELRVSSAHPTLSTLSNEWVSSIQTHYSQLDIRWDHRVAVPMTTLDALIAGHGVPRFIKIDVEGFEPEVLAGLSHPVDLISFEFLPASSESALACLRLLSQLGDYRFQYSMVETMRFASDEWTDASRMEQILRAMPPHGRSGDIYARKSGA